MSLNPKWIAAGRGRSGSILLCVLLCRGSGGGKTPVSSSSAVIDRKNPRRVHRTLLITEFFRGCNPRTPELREVPQCDRDRGFPW